MHDGSDGPIKPCKEETMVDLAVLMTRRSDLSLAQFRDYYENHHAPMGIRYFAFEKYVRNYVIGTTPGNIAIDCVMTCTVNRSKSNATMAASDVDQMFREDEARFMTTRGEGVDPTGKSFAGDTLRAVSVARIEQHVMGEAEHVDTAGTQKQMLLVSNGGQLDDAEYLRRLVEWSDRVATSAAFVRVTIDAITPGQEDVHFPAETLITAWLGTITNPEWGNPPAGVKLGAVLQVEAYETSPALLAEEFGKC